MRIDLHNGLIFIAHLSCGSSSSNELIASLISDPMVISAEVEVEFCLVVARGLCVGEAPKLIVPGVCGYSFHLMTSKVSDSC